MDVCFRTRIYQLAILEICYLYQSTQSLTYTHTFMLRLFASPIIFLLVVTCISTRRKQIPVAAVIKSLSNQFAHTHSAIRPFADLPTHPHMHMQMNTQIEAHAQTRGAEYYWAFEIHWKRLEKQLTSLQRTVRMISSSYLPLGVSSKLTIGIVLIGTRSLKGKYVNFARIFLLSNWLLFLFDKNEHRTESIYC